MGICAAFKLLAFYLAALTLENEIELKLSKFKIFPREIFFSSVLSSSYFHLVLFLTGEMGLCC